MNISKEARDIHYSALVVDTHSDSLAWPTRHGVDIGQPQEETHMDLPRMREGNQNVQFFACFAAPSWIEKKKVVQVTLDYMDSFHTLMRDYPMRLSRPRRPTTFAASPTLGSSWASCASRVDTQSTTIFPYCECITGSARGI